jgi:APA family basic amino acid/polyamine antiporter
MREPKGQLIRGLTATDTTALVVGTVIGSGVFLKTSVMTQDVGTPALVMAAWVAAGLLSLAGALTFAELGAMFPAAGGEYVYLKKSYGETAAFLFGWQRFVVAGSASVASLASGFAIFLAAFLPLNAVWLRREVTLLGQTIDWQFGPRQLVAVAAILFLSVLNCFSVALGGRVQSALTVLKIAGIAFVVLGIFFFSGSADWSHLRAAAGTAAWSGWAAFGTAMLAALWATTAGTTSPWRGPGQDPGRNVPRASSRRDARGDGDLLPGQPGLFLRSSRFRVVTSNSTRYGPPCRWPRGREHVPGEYGGSLWRWRSWSRLSAP